MKLQLEIDDELNERLMEVLDTEGFDDREALIMFVVNEYLDSYEEQMRELRKKND